MLQKTVPIDVILIRHFWNQKGMGRVNFRKDFWDCLQGLGKNWPIADRRVISNDPRINRPFYRYGAHIE